MEVDAQYGELGLEVAGSDSPSTTRPPESSSRVMKAFAASSG
jgi:hypothetical protein